MCSASVFFYVSILSRVLYICLYRRALFSNFRSGLASVLSLMGCRYCSQKQSRYFLKKQKYLLRFILLPRNPCKAQNSSEPQQQRRLKDYRNQFVFKELPVPSGKVSFGAHGSAFLACDAFPVSEAVLFQPDVHRTLIPAGPAALDAAFFLSLQRGEGKLGQKREDRPHRAQELAEKALPESHSGDDGRQQDPAAALFCSVRSVADSLPAPQAHRRDKAAAAISGAVNMPLSFSFPGLFIWFYTPDCLICLF